MLADDAACNNRNKFPGNVYANPGQGLDLYGDNIEVDYRGYEVTVENFIRLLTGFVLRFVPAGVANARTQVESTLRCLARNGS